MINSKEHIIDAVILWVDGNDENHRNKMLPFLEDKDKIKNERFRTRFDQIGEIKYTVHSIIKFAPFIRNIFIVTDNQTPSFLEEDNTASKYQNVSVIDHKEIFKGSEEFLPTFNSITIESCIHKIPDLAECFIYLNDDFFIINHTKPEDFFRDGLPVLRGKWLKFDEHILYKRFVKKRSGHKSAQQRSAKILGFDKYYNFKHTPHPLRKSTLENYFSKNKNLLSENLKYKFRNNNQFLTQGVSNHLEIQNKTCHLENDTRLLYFRSFKKSLAWYKIKLERVTDNKLFLGLQSLDRSPPNILEFIINWLNKRIL